MYTDLSVSATWIIPSYVRLRHLNIINFYSDNVGRKIGGVSGLYNVLIMCLNFEVHSFDSTLTKDIGI